MSAGVCPVVVSNPYGEPIRAAGWYTVEPGIGGPPVLLRYFKSEDRAREEARRKWRYSLQVVAAERVQVQA